MESYDGVVYHQRKTIPSHLGLNSSNSRARGIRASAYAMLLLVHWATYVCPNASTRVIVHAAQNKRLTTAAILHPTATCSCSHRPILVFKAIRYSKKGWVRTLCNQFPGVSASQGHGKDSVTYLHSLKVALWGLLLVNGPPPLITSPAPSLHSSRLLAIRTRLFDCNLLRFDSCLPPVIRFVISHLEHPPKGWGPLR